MLTRHVIGALNRGIQAKDEDEARRIVAAADPVARWFAKPKLERAMIDAALACDAAGVGAPAPDHVMRVAALTAAGSPPANARDVDAVVEAHRGLANRTAPRLPFLTAFAVSMVLAAGAAIALAILTAPGESSRTYAKPMPPPSAQAFVSGGVPLRDPAIDALVAQPLTDLVVAGGKARDGEPNQLAAMLGQLRSPAALARDPKLVETWNAMLDVFDRSVKLGARPKTQREYDDMVEAVRELSQAFLAAGLGYHLEGRFKNGYPFIQAYRVEEVVVVRAGDARRRVLSLRRADRLNARWAALGIHDEDVGDPVLHLDQIDRHVASDVIPVLAEGAPYALGDKEWMTWPQNRKIATTVADSIRREYSAVLGADAPATIEVATLLVKRGDIIEGWRDKLERRNLYFIETDGLFVPQRVLSWLDGKVLNSERERVSSIDRRIAALQGPRLHSRIHDLVAATTRRHEAQHGLDYDRDAELRYPQPLFDLLGSPHDSDGDPRAIVDSARAELSGYLSEIANEPATPHAAALFLAVHLFHRNRWGTGESYAAMVIVEGLARQLGVTLDGRRYDRGVNRDRLVPAVTAIAAASNEALRAAATALWSELYGEPLVPIVDVR